MALLRTQKETTRSLKFGATQEKRFILFRFVKNR